MRTNLTLIAAALATFMMTTAHAANSTADLSISANVVPSACNFSVGDGGAYDYGDTLFASLRSGAVTSLPYITKAVSLQCDAPTLVKIKTIDNRHGTGTVNVATPSNAVFGLGLDRAGNQIGSTRFELKNTILNGAPGYAIYKRDNDNGGTWTRYSSGKDIEHGEYYISFASTSNATTPSPVTDVTWNFTNKTVINDKSTLDGTQAIMLDGFATMELIYI